MFCFFHSRVVVTHCGLNWDTFTSEGNTALHYPGVRGDCRYSAWGMTQELLLR